MIPSVITAFTSLVSNWFQNKIQKQKAQHELDVAELQNKARLMLDEQSNNHAWEMANLQDKDKWLRRISFTMFSAPLVIAIFSPHQIKDYFDIALSSVPEWWLKTFVAINGAVWGIANLKNVLPPVVDLFKKNT